jgi:hypothetical protein
VGAVSVGERRYGEIFMSEKCCGTCKWLNVSERHLTKSGEIHGRYKHETWRCNVPLEVTLPACMSHVILTSRSFMAQDWGKDCSFWEPR